MAAIPYGAGYDANGVSVGAKFIFAKYSGTITKGDLLVWDIDAEDSERMLTVKRATPALSGNMALVAGVACESGVAGDEGKRVARVAIVKDANVLTGVAAGSQLFPSASTDGRMVAGNTANVFLSAEQTGTGSAQNVAHGLGSVPDLVFTVASNLTGGAYVVTAGTHTSTNAVFTVTSGEKYRVVAVRFQGAPVASALTTAADNKADILVCLP